MFDYHNIESALTKNEFEELQTYCETSRDTIYLKYIIDLWERIYTLREENLNLVYENLALEEQLKFRKRG